MNWTPGVSFIEEPIVWVKKWYFGEKEEIEGHQVGERARVKSIFVSRSSRKAVTFCQCYKAVWTLVTKV
jgi:hypothetical protein